MPTICQATQHARIGVLNLMPTSICAIKQKQFGSPFRQIAEYCQRARMPFIYCCLGVALLVSNTQACCLSRRSD